MPNFGKTKTIFTLLFMSAVAWTSCEKPAEPMDPLEELGLLGVWLRDTTIINGLVVSTSSADSLEFETGVSEADYYGVYTTSSPGYSFSGEFNVDVANETVGFRSSDTTYGTREFVLKPERLIFMFEVGPKSYVEYWGKVR